MIFLENRKYVSAVECDAYFLDPWYRYFPTVLHKEDKIAHMRSTQKFDLHLYWSRIGWNIFTLTFKQWNDHSPRDLDLGNKNIMEIKSSKQITKAFYF